MAETDPPEVSAFRVPLMVAEAEFAAAALDFCVPDAVQHRDIAARGVDVQFTLPPVTSIGRARVEIGVPSQSLAVMSPPLVSA
jgi:predicted ester cyclase